MPSETAGLQNICPGQQVHLTLSSPHQSSNTFWKCLVSHVIWSIWLMASMSIIVSPFVVGCNDLNSPCFWIKWPRTSHSLHNQHYVLATPRQEKISFPLVKCTQKYQLLGHGSSKKSRPPLITIFFPKSQQEHASYSYFEHNFCSRQLCWGAIYPKNRGNTIQIFWAKE